MSDRKEDRILSYKGIPIAVKIIESKRLSEYYYYNGKQGVELYAAFPAGGVNRELGIEFVKYLQKE